MIEFSNLTDNDSHVITESNGMFSVVEHKSDMSVAPDNAMTEYFMKKMNVLRRQLMVTLDGENGVAVQAGAMQWMAGDVHATTGVKGVGDLMGKTFRGIASNESIIKPEYERNGVLMLEPTYRYILLEDVSTWDGGLIMENGMFLACYDTVKQKISGKKSVSSAMLGNEKFWNLKLEGEGICALESNVPRSEIIEIRLQDDVLKIDGSFAICWSGNLKFTVERAGKSLVGSYYSGEGLVNTYSGTGKVWISPLTPTQSFTKATHDKNSEEKAPESEEIETSIDDGEK